jgi:hypothetical protein
VSTSGALDVFCNPNHLPSSASLKLDRRVAYSPFLGFPNAYTEPQTLTFRPTLYVIGTTGGMSTKSTRHNAEVVYDRRSQWNRNLIFIHLLPFPSHSAFPVPPQYLNYCRSAACERDGERRRKIGRSSGKKGYNGGMRGGGNGR